jgi:hypothetical protein
MKFFSKSSTKSTPADFWAWLQSPVGRKALNGLTESSSMRAASGQITTELHKVNKDLQWGYANLHDAPGRFEVSAGGIRSMIPVVEDLIAAAPDMEGIQVIAFRQPISGFRLSLSPDGKDAIEPDATLCVATPRDGGLFDVHLYIPAPASVPANAMAQIAFTMLDHTLGEFFVMKKVGLITQSPLAEAPPDAIPLTEWATQVLV